MIFTKAVMPNRGHRFFHRPRLFVGPGVRERVEYIQTIDVGHVKVQSYQVRLKSVKKVSASRESLRPFMVNYTGNYCPPLARLGFSVGSACSETGIFKVNSVPSPCLLENSIEPL
jgi:hypothetical protein